MTSEAIHPERSWTEEKLQILEGYLKAYTTALKNRDFHLTYVDAFAGTGYVSRDATQSLATWGDDLDDMSKDVLQGSTRRAIAVNDKPFDSFIFVEQNPEHAAALRRMQHEFGERDIKVERAEANGFLQMWCDAQNRLLGISQGTASVPSCSSIPLPHKSNGKPYRLLQEHNPLTYGFYSRCLRSRGYCLATASLTKAMPQPLIGFTEVTNGVPCIKLESGGRCSVTNWRPFVPSKRLLCSCIWKG